ncbi:hypothetical protein BY458DRAFT_427770 [Sporodiniella umbellata]|nr:hypothetical protein BY458DRAFT_427770 [Sporodiniella umbellata]
MGSEASAIRFTIGLFVSLGASFMDALGLNILKLDHVKESGRESQRGDCARPLWHMGLYTYIISQLIGSTIALNYLKTQWVAPLGSVALIFNFIFAKILVGTKITRKDVLGTCVVVGSVIWIVVFGGIALNILTFGGLFVSIWSSWEIDEKSRRGLKRNLFINIDQKKMKHVVGLMFSIEGGLLASETLLLAKSGVKLFTLSLQSKVNQFDDNASRLILVALVITAIMQVYCLNTALKLYSSVVVVPVFYGTYTAVGLVNTIIYLDEISNYPPWAIVLVFVGIAVLIYGVALLSSKSEPMDLPEEEELQEITSDHWLAEKIEDSKAVEEMMSEGSGSSGNASLEKAQDRQGVYLWMKVKEDWKRLLGKREMDTFISLHSLTDPSSFKQK